MTIMRRASNSKQANDERHFFSELWHFVGRNKYLLTILFFVVIIVFLDENNVFVHIKNKYEIARLSSQRDSYSATCDSLMEELKSLDTNGSSLERIAREQYGMHEEDEEVFIIRGAR